MKNEGTGPDVNNNPLSRFTGASPGRINTRLAGFPAGMDSGEAPGTTVDGAATGLVQETAIPGLWPKNGFQGIPFPGNFEE